MSNEVPVTKILFVDNDEMGFQFRKCMAQALKSLPPVELFHATDASEALALVDSLRPHVIVVDDECKDETDLLMDSLSPNHPPILLQTSEQQKNASTPTELVTRIQKNESLEGIHYTLLLASSLGIKNGSQQTPETVH